MPVQVLAFTVGTLKLYEFLMFLVVLQHPELNCPSIPDIFRLNPSVCIFSWLCVAQVIIWESQGAVQKSNRT